MIRSTCSALLVAPIALRPIPLPAFRLPVQPPVLRDFVVVALVGLTALTRPALAMFAFAMSAVAAPVVARAACAVAPQLKHAVHLPALAVAWGLLWHFAGLKDSAGEAVLWAIVGLVTAYVTGNAVTRVARARTSSAPIARSTGTTSIDDNPL